MSNEIGVTGLATGLTLYATIRDATNQVWNGTAFESQVQANLSTYAVTMTENGTTGTYLVAFPATIAAGVYSRTVRIRVGGSPAWTDPVLASDSAFQWSGTAEVSLASRSTYAGGDTAGTTTLLTRVTGAVALANQIPANFTTATFASAGVFSTGALANTPASLDANALRSAMGLATANLDTQLALRTGFKLAGDGLDAIVVPDPTGVATTFPQMVVQTWRRFFGKVTRNRTTGEIKTFAADGATVLTTQTATDDDTTQTQGAAS